MPTFRNKSAKEIIWEHSIHYVKVMIHENHVNMKYMPFVIFTTLHESLIWIYFLKHTLLGLFPVTEFILHVHCIFLFDACKLSWCLHVHEIDTGTKGNDPHPNSISELFEIKKKKMRPTFTFFLWKHSYRHYKQFLKTNIAFFDRHIKKDTKNNILFKTSYKDE